MREVSVILIGGLGEAVPLFLIASGLTLVYGVLRVLNFAHGGLFMLGAYVTNTILHGQSTSTFTFIGAVILASLTVGAVGAVIEPTIFRPLYRHAPELSLLTSFGLMQAIIGATIVIWGGLPRLQEAPPSLRGSLPIGSIRVSSYNLLEVVVGILVAVGLAWLLRGSKVGVQATAVAEDREMARALGVRANRINLSVFILGSVLAGLSGGLVAPTVSISSGLAVSFILQAFAVVLMGGLGSVAGALVASIVLGIADATLVVYVPWLAPYSFFLILGVFIAVRPTGLFGYTTVAESIR